MSKATKKFLSLVLTLAMLISLTACGGTNDTSDDAPEDDKSHGRDRRGKEVQGRLVLPLLECV